MYINSNRISSCLFYFTGQSDVRIKDKETGPNSIECKITDQEKIQWCTYGSVDYGLGSFTHDTKTSGTKYSAPSTGGIFMCTTEKKHNVTSKVFRSSQKTLIISAENGMYHC